MDTLRSILDFFNNLTAEEWGLITQFVVAAISLPFVVQIVKLILGISKKLRLESDNAKYALSLLVTVAVSVFEYAHGNPEFGKWFLAGQTAINFVTSQSAYRFGLKYLFRAVGSKFLEIWQRELAKAYQSNAARDAAVAPTDTTTPDFL